MTNDPLDYVRKIVEILPEDKEAAISALQIAHTYMCYLRRLEIDGFSNLN